MNIKNIFSFLSRKAETATPKTITDSWFPAFSQGLRNTTGEAVTTTSALSLSAVWGCVNVISQDVSKIPFHCFQKTDKGKKRISNNLDKILNYSPNPF